jgi:undecaprenyl-diphosphatase
VELIELLKALLIGIVEGITEWLPISSTGHMILVDEFITLNVSDAFKSLFLVVIQLGAIMAVIILYFHKLNPFARQKTTRQRRSTLRLWAKVIVGCIPAAILGGLLSDWFEEKFFSAVPVAIALVVYGIVFIVVERIKAQQTNSPAPPLQGAHARSAYASAHRSADRVLNVDELSFARAFGIGIFQCLAVIPGTSRSGSTILGGRILGVSREAAAEFSFFLAIPVMFGWSGLKVVKTFVLDNISVTASEWAVLAVGVIVAFVVSVVAIKFLMGFIKKHSFEAFGWYRIVLGIAVLAFFLLSGQLLGN